MWLWPAIQKIHNIVWICCYSFYYYVDRLICFKNEIKDAYSSNSIAFCQWFLAAMIIFWQIYFFLLKLWKYNLYRNV